MKIKIANSRIIKPCYEGTPPSTNDYTPLSVFDKINYDTHVAVIYAYRAPTPQNAEIELGLQKALSVYREWAGRFGTNENGEPMILLNDNGVRFVEASVDSTLDQLMPLEPSPSLLNLHPPLHGVEELVQVQLTRFKCGSLVVGFTWHHLVGDGQSTSNFLVACGQATRGVEINPTPLRNRSIFKPRNQPQIGFEHKGVEFISKKFKNNYSHITDVTAKDIVVHKVHFTVEFLSKLKAKVSQNTGNSKKGYTTFESLVAHLWRAITKARGLSGYESTHVRISVNGRTRLNPKVPDYFGNFVLWAFPASKVKDLLNEPLGYAANLIHEAVAKMDDNYFKSFIDFANYKAKDEDLITTADAEKPILSPNIDVHSWLRFPFYDLDFGTGRPFIFLPSYLPIEGLIFLLPSYVGGGSIDVFLPLFKDHLATFKKDCYSLD